MRKALLPLMFLAAFGLIGCSSKSPDVDTTVKAGSGEIQNPGGKPQNAQQAAYDAQMQQTGAAMNAEMQKEAAAMQAARSRAGGK